MNDRITELVCILDKSGSMAGMESDTVGGFNAMLDRQREIDGTVLVTTILFSGTATVLHDRLPLCEVPPMRREDYSVGGTTALLDTVGDAILHIETVHKYARDEDVPSKTVFMITTDGMENASRRFDRNRIKELIQRKQEQGWAFLFAADNIDAVETAGTIGIRADCATNYSVEKDTDVMFEKMSDAICCFRSTGTARADWGERVRDARPTAGKRR